MENKYTCRKVSYSTKEFADLDIIRIKKKSNRNSSPTRSYKCKNCNTWHLTKSEDVPTLRKINSELVKEIEILKSENKILRDNNKALRDNMPKKKGKNVLEAQLEKYKNKTIYYFNLKEKIDKERTYLVRKMVSILGEDFYKELSQWRSENENIPPESKLKIDKTT